MQRLLPPDGGDVDVAATYAADGRPAPDGRPWLLLDMVASIDGAVEVGGRSRALSSPGDRLVFHGLRALADVIVVGAGTARAERYGPPRLDTEVADARAAAGRRPQPELVVVSAGLGFPADQPFFASDQPVVVATSAGAPSARRRELVDRGAEVIDVGDEEVRPDRLVAALADRGHHVAVCEGGPTLNGALLDADVVDEVCLTVATLVAGGHAGRIAVGPQLDPPLAFELDRVLHEDSTLFLRYLRARPHR